MHDNIGLFLSKRAHLDPTVEAFVDVASGLRLSYHELNQRANQTAHFLTGLGIKRGDRVALLMLNCPAYLELFFGLAKIGAVTVPLNIRLVADELAYIIQDSGSRLLMFGPEFTNISEELQNKRDQIKSVENFVFVAGPDSSDADQPDFALDYEGLRLHRRLMNLRYLPARKKCST